MYSLIKKLFKSLILSLLLIFTFSIFSPWISSYFSIASLADDRVSLDHNVYNYHYPISTSSQLAQQYFDEGLTLTYGFNHIAAASAFKKAIEIDPDCVMCRWGLAYVLGPNINVPMSPEQSNLAWQKIQEAIAVKNKGTPKEKDYVEALARRYTPKPVTDRTELDLAYAEAMGKMMARYPEDLDAATLYAEALMDTMPWDYWQENGEIKPEAQPIIDTLEYVLKQNPQHLGANHFYIHAVEEKHPELAIEAADNLRDLIPDSGHLQHMPSHIYIRVGRYQDAVIANQKAIKADTDYLLSSSLDKDSPYNVVYIPHNYHFLWFAALMSGQEQIATEAAEKTADIDFSLIKDPDFAGALQHYYSIPLYTKVRFSQWQEILNTPAPNDNLKYPNGVWHYARGMAFTALGDEEQANRELLELQSLVSDPDLVELEIWGFNSTAKILNIASEVLAGTIDNYDRHYNQAVAHLQKAIEIEDNLIYTEPADWYSPCHHLLAEIHRQNDRFQEAEAEYRQDLAIYPNNGWSLRGLAKTLRAEGKIDEAKVIEQQFAKAWQYARLK